LADKKLREGRLKTKDRDLGGAKVGIKDKAHLNRINDVVPAYCIDVRDEYREIQFWGN
jgi:hypothetical protein